MARTVLVADADSSTGKSLIHLLLDAGQNVIATTAFREEATKPEDIRNTPYLSIHWNKRSPLSARNILLQGLNRFESIDEAIITLSPGKENQPFHEAKGADIEAKVDDSVKGTLFLLRELVNYFAQRKTGVVALAACTEGSDVLPPLEAFCFGSFRALGDSLFAFYQNEPVLFYGFECYGSGMDEFAEFILRTLRDRGRKNAGKWMKFQDRGGFLSSFTQGKAKR